MALEDDLTITDLGWWFTWSYVDRECSDGCTLFPDVVLGFRLYKICLLHDFAYRGKPILGREKIESRFAGDLMMLRGMLRQALRDALNEIHLLVLVLLAFVVYLLLRITGWFAWYVMNDRKVRG